MIPVKQYLKQIKRLDDMIKTKQSELDLLNDLVKSITVPLQENKIQSSGSDDKLGKTVAKIVDLQKEINSNIDEFVDIRTKIIRQIDQVTEPDLHKLLCMRYFQYKSWNDIAMELSNKDEPFSLQWVHKLHSKALQKFQEIIDS